MLDTPLEAMSSFPAHGTLMPSGLASESLEEDRLPSVSGGRGARSLTVLITENEEIASPPPPAAPRMAASLLAGVSPTSALPPSAQAPQALQVSAFQSLGRAFSMKPRNMPKSHQSPGGVDEVSAFGTYNTVTANARAVPASPRLGYWTEIDQASESCTGKVLYYTI